MMQNTKDDDQCTIWNPNYLTQKPKNLRYAVIVLNSPILCNKQLVTRLWSQAVLRVTVDGGTDRWKSFIGFTSEEIMPKSDLLPDVVSGDLDSICKYTLDNLRSTGVEIVMTPDQLETDYTKAVRLVAGRNLNLEYIYVLVEPSGRFDHVMANLSTLYKCRKILDNREKIIHVARDCLTWVLQPGSHEIVIPEGLREKKHYCGLVPFGGPVNCITSTGLKYNLKNSRLEVEGLVSSSNSYEENSNSNVHVTTDSPVLWTMEIGDLMH